MHRILRQLVLTFHRPPKKVYNLCTCLTFIFCTYYPAYAIAPLKSNSSRPKLISWSKKDVEKERDPVSETLIPFPSLEIWCISRFFLHCCQDAIRAPSLGWPTVPFQTLTGELERKKERKKIVIQCRPVTMKCFGKGIQLLK